MSIRRLRSVNRKKKATGGSVAHTRKQNQLSLQPALLTFALLVEESTTTVMAMITFLHFHLTGVAQSSGRKISTHHVGTTLDTVGLIAGVILTSVVASALTEGLPTGFAFQMVMPIDDEDAEGIPIALITGCHLSGDHFLIVADDLNID